MKTTCLINNYNYGHFLPAAIDSVLGQSTPFDQVIVVDDGSTDGSPPLVRRRYGNNGSVTLVAKENAGQLSCFNEGFRHARGDLVCFLDADDMYAPEYLERVVGTFQAQPHVDVTMAGVVEVDSGGRRLREHPGPDRDLGYSVIATWSLRKWLGAPTSCLSFRRTTLSRVLPVPFVEDWRTRADDCLVFGASLVGARKFRLGTPLVRYRRHGANHFAGSVADPRRNYRRKLALNRLIEHFVRREGYDTQRLVEATHREFRTIPHPTLRELREYLAVVRQSRLRMSRKAAMSGSMLVHFGGRSLAAVQGGARPGSPAVPASGTGSGSAADVDAQKAA